MKFKDLQIGDLFTIQQGNNIYQKTHEERFLGLFNTKVYKSSVQRLVGLVCNTEDDMEVSKVENIEEVM